MAEAESSCKVDMSKFGIPNQRFQYSNQLLCDDDSQSTNSFTTENEFTLKPHITVQNWLKKILHTTKYQVVIVALIVLDTLVVIAELLLDLELAGRSSKVPEILHCISLSLLCIFVVELTVKFYAYRLEFFSHKGEVFDAVVVTVALILDAVSVNFKDAFAGVGLVIVLRLWRVVRIQNSMVMSVHKSGEKRLSKEHELRLALERELEVSKEDYRQLKQCCRELLQLLTDNGINLPPSLTLPDLEH